MSHKKNILLIMFTIVMTLTLVYPHYALAGDGELINVSGFDNTGGGNPTETDHTGNNSPGGSSGPGDPNAIPSGGFDCGDGVKAFCSVRKGSSSWSKVYADVYDMQGNKIGNVLNINTDFLAGTYVGLDVYESKGYNSWASYSITAKKYYYKCTKEQRGSCKLYSTCHGTNGPFPCSPCKEYNTYTDEYTSLTGCGPTWQSELITEDASACSAAVANCASKAVPARISLSPSYSVAYKDSNDINASASGDKYYTAATINSTTGRNCSESYSAGNPSTRTGTCKFTYNREKTCINVKTGKVRYIGKNEQCDSNVEYAITSNGKYWKYFIPLNTKSSDGFSFAMYASNNTQSAGLCKNIIDKYDHYADLIVDANRNPLPRVTKGMSKSQINAIKTSAKKIVSNGCKYQTTATIPVAQRFYNEINNGNNFNGFNFYYKPIDINDPFPNGLTNTSIWYDWLKASKKDPDLTKSYKDVTYIAQITDTNDIREYTKVNPYTSWNNMYVSGTSSFIENAGVVNRYVARNSYYKLGCGPTNEKSTDDKGIPNPFYQQECGK